MAVTATETVRDIITDALLDLEAVQMGQSIPAKQADHAKRTLNRLMKSWQLMDGTPAFLKASMTVPVQASASRSLEAVDRPERPIRLLSVRYDNGTSELPMIELTRDEYDELPNKDATGTPTQFYYDRQKQDALFYVWPVPSSASGNYQITYEREFEDVSSLNDVIDLPAEWYDAAVKQLAARLAPAYGSEAAKGRLPAEAAYALNLALAHGMAGESVHFGAGDA